MICFSCPWKFVLYILYIHTHTLRKKWEQNFCTVKKSFKWGVWVDVKLLLKWLARCSGILLLRQENYQLVGNVAYTARPCLKTIIINLLREHSVYMLYDIVIWVTFIYLFIWLFKTGFLCIITILNFRNNNVATITVTGYFYVLSTFLSKWFPNIKVLDSHSDLWDSLHYIFI